MFECFDEVLRKASSWVRHQRRVRVTNVQSIDYKLKHDYGDTNNNNNNNNNNNTQDDIYSAVTMTTRLLREFSRFI